MYFASVISIPAASDSVTGTNANSMIATVAKAAMALVVDLIGSLLGLGCLRRLDG